MSMFALLGCADKGAVSIPASNAVTLTVAEPAVVSVSTGGTTLVSGAKLAETGIAANTAITITVATTAGTISMMDARGAPISGSGGSSITATDTLPNLDADLASLTYTAGSLPGIQNLTISAEGGGVTGVGTSVISAHPAFGGTRGQFSVANGRIIGPSGQPFLAKGINVLDSEMRTVSTSSAVTPLLTVLPGTNFVRLAAEYAGNGNFSGDSVPALTNFVNQLTAKGIVVEIEDHDTNNAVYSESSSPSLGQVTAWYSSLATAFSGNPYVWFGTPNEPGAGDSPNELAVYQAIRATGNSSMVLMEYFNGNDVNPSVYTHMTNVAWDMHFYANSNPGASSASQGDVVQALTSYVQSLQSGSGITSANGTMPVVIGEFGNSFAGNTGGSGDANGALVVSAVLSSTAISGYAAWLWNWPGSRGIADNLVYQDNATLTSYGQQVAAAIAAPTPTSSGTSGSLSANTKATATKSIMIPQTHAIAVLLERWFQSLEVAAAFSDDLDQGGAPSQPTVMVQTDHDWVDSQDLFSD